MLSETVTKIVVLSIVCVAGFAYNYVIAFRPEIFDRRHEPTEQLFGRKFRSKSYRIGGCLGMMFTLVFFAFLVREVIFLLSLL